MALTLPPPPKNRGVAGLLLTLLFVGWTGYLLATYADKKTVATPPRQSPGYVEMDLRGPEYDVGRYEGYQKGRAARWKGDTLPAEKVLALQAEEESRSKSPDLAGMEDFVAGYKSGFAQAMKAEITPADPQK